MAISCGIITTAIVLATHKKEAAWKLWPSKAVAGNNCYLPKITRIIPSFTLVRKLRTFKTFTTGHQKCRKRRKCPLN